MYLRKGPVRAGSSPTTINYLVISPSFCISTYGMDSLDLNLTSSVTFLSYNVHRREFVNEKVKKVKVEQSPLLFKNNLFRSLFRIPSIIFNSVLGLCEDAE